MEFVGGMLVGAMLVVMALATMVAVLIRRGKRDRGGTLW